MGRDITVDGKDGRFGAYLAEPASSRGPAIVVIQEIFGINAHIRRICDAHAAKGRFAIAPDLFWRLEPNVQLTDQTPEEWQRAFALKQRFNADTGVDDIQSSLDYVRAVPGCSGKAGAVGYCLGGMLAFMTAARTNSDATVGYYGLAIETLLNEAQSIKAPLMLHIAGKDKYVDAAAQQKIIETLANHPQATSYLYPEMNHAFARPGGEHYDKANAELADARTDTFFRQHLV